MQKLIKNWDFLPTLSNRRLVSHILGIEYKMMWSIDRITIVGRMKIDVDEFGDFLISKGFAKEIGRGWSLIDKFDENIAYIERVKFSKFEEMKCRIDFNPNKIGTWIDDDLKAFIHELFDEPHFSRADIACDVFNIPNDYMQQYRLNDSVTFKPIYGRTGELETAYWGARSSERQVRMYNKYLEQSKKKEYIPDEISSWWRVEVQLRRTKSDEWNSVIHETLENFCSPFYIPEHLSVTDEIAIKGLMSDQNLWSKLSKNSKTKYRNLVRKIVKEDELTKELFKSFDEYQNELKRELDTWLRGIDVTGE